MLERKAYLEQLLSWKDEPVIKVITGICRCGKTTLLAQFQNLLIQNGVADSQIISINFEDPENEDLLDYRKLNSYLKERLDPDRKNYIFLDEVQRVDSFEKVVDSLYAKDDLDLYLTSSNVCVQPGKLTNLLTGRYVEIHVLPFSFREFCEIAGNSSDEVFSEYLNIGGLPDAVSMDRHRENLNTCLEGLYYTVIVKELEERQERKKPDPNKRNVTDVALLQSIARFLAGRVGSPVSVRSMTNFLASGGRKVSPNTVKDYMDTLCESFLFYEAGRFDLSSQKWMKSNHKFYMVDLGFRNYLLPKGSDGLDPELENIVFFELLRRGYQVNTGKFGDKEVDFVARKNDEVSYFQVTADMTHKETFEREMKPLKLIKDSYEKIVLTLDRFTPGNYEGIQVINAIDWLLE